MENEHVKVFFVQQIDNDQMETESLWCTVQGEYFVIDNIPFVAKRISLGDTIKAEYDEEDQAYYFEDFVEVSGNTTVRIYLEDESLIETIRGQLKELGCESEVLLQRRIIAVNIPQDIQYTPVKEYLERGELSKLWVYEESCLAHE